VRAPVFDMQKRNYFEETSLQMCCCCYRRTACTNLVKHLVSNSLVDNNDSAGFSFHVVTVLMLEYS
jgi:hypothetical protein